MREGFWELSGINHNSVIVLRNISVLSAVEIHNVHVGIHIILFFEKTSKAHIAPNDSTLELKMKRNADEELPNLL